jgi:GNAT superfamily N-acetyltransferase
MVDLQLRPADAGDLALLLGLMRGLYDSDHMRFDEVKAERALAGLLADPLLGRVWLIESDGAVVGYAVLTLGYSLEFGGRYALLDELFIAEPHRGQGLGRQVLARLEEVCRDFGVMALRLEVERANRGARSLYERVGFEVHERDLMTLWLDPGRRGRGETG